MLKEMNPNTAGPKPALRDVNRQFREGPPQTDAATIRKVEFCADDRPATETSSTSKGSIRYNTQEAVIYLRDKYSIRVAEATMHKLRSVGGGARFDRFGRSILYQEQSLNEWAEGKLVTRCRSTSEA